MAFSNYSNNLSDFKTKFIVLFSTWENQIQRIQVNGK